MSLTKQKGVTIHCKRCGTPRVVHAQNYEDVKYCKSCAYDVKREYNSAYVKRRRQEKNKNEENTDCSLGRW